MITTRTLLGLAAAATFASGVCADPPTLQAFNGDAPMIDGDTPATGAGWTATPIYTVGHPIGQYLPTGILDGTGAYKVKGRTVRLLVNSELNEGNGLPYALDNGTLLTGARVHFFDVDKKTGEIKDAGVAYDRIRDRAGNVVTDPAQVNEDGNAIDGLARLCSARSVDAGWLGFVDDIFFTGEESSEPFHPHGGTEWALDVEDRTLWAVPAMGRAAWENVTPVWSGSPDTVALLGGDDREGAPLYLYVGRKDALGDGSFLDRNGLAVGNVYAWVSDDGSTDPEGGFTGTGSSRTGTFVEIEVRDPAMAGAPGHDAAGYKDSATLDAEAAALGAYNFTRPEDLHENPADPSRVVFASTGRGGLYPSDNWGTLYLVDLNVAGLTAELTIVHDGDEVDKQDFGIRSPDNLTWASDGLVYVQEDRSTSPGGLFGGSSGVEASIWQLDPDSGDFTRLFEVDRSVVLPAGTTDIGAGTIGHWETSGILDVSNLFPKRGSSVVLLATVQAHGIRDGEIGDDPVLDEGGQLVLLTNRQGDDDRDRDEDD